MRRRRLSKVNLVQTNVAQALARLRSARMSTVRLSPFLHHPPSSCPNTLPVNSVDDFCIFAPPNPGPDSVIGNTERIEVAWCLKDGYGTRLIPENTITGAHFVQTPDYVQVTGVGDLTKINIPAQDAGGELDPHGADGNGQYERYLIYISVLLGCNQLTVRRL